MQMTLPVPAATYPARLEGHLEQPSRWLWLVKWLLALPHFVVLAFLWLAFVVLSVAAFVKVLFTGRYPHGIFDFNVGVLRWTWRVLFYCFGANGTDRYPPFTLADVPGYPARLEVAYPAWQRKGFRLIGWWLAGIPQYVIAGVFGCGAVFAVTDSWAGVSLIGMLVFVSMLVLLVRGTYPRSIFDFVLGLNRWVLRVSAYAAVMTPEYPPFRVDPGEDEPGGLTLGTESAAPAPEAAERPWGAGRVLAVVLGSLAVLVALTALAAGTAAVVIDGTQRDAAGYLTSDARLYSTDTYALVSDGYRTGGAGDVITARDVLGKVRITSDSSQRVFVGIGPAAEVDAYLANVRRDVATRFDVSPSDFRVVPGGAPTALPQTQGFWAARAVGAGTQRVTWAPKAGHWRVVVMNADGSANVVSRLSVGARVPHLLAIGAGALGAGAILLAAGVLGLWAGVRRRPA